MTEKRFVAFMLRYMLKEHFGSKRAMARILNMELRTIQINFKNLDVAKGGIVAFERVVLFCCEHDINILDIYYKETIPIFV